jgi:hypothetical protein
MTELNQPLFLFLAAKEYFENGMNYASKYFRIKDGVLIKPFDGAVHSKLCVPITNVSFALELAFKSLLMLKSTKKTGHDLMVLFEKLDESFKNKIFAHYKTYDSYRNYISIRLTYRGDKEHGTFELIKQQSKTETFVLDMIQVHKDTFKDFRYLYEFDGKSNWHFYFREFGNYIFSVLVILGEELGHKVVFTKIKSSSVK